MSTVCHVDVATLHNDCNLGQTLVSLPNVTLSPRSLENLLEKACLCTLKEVLFHLNLEKIDISRCSKESQIQFLTWLMSERFHSTCFTDACNICIKCSLSPDLEVSISNGNVEELKEGALELINGASQIPDSKKLHLACLAKDHQRVKDLLKEAHTTDLKEKNMFIFYGISCGEIVDILVNSGADVNTEDARGRTPLFYALISSLESAKKLLDKGASVTETDHCQVSVLTFFAENMLKNYLAADVKVQGIKLLQERGISRAQMIQEVMNLILCKFIQVLGTVQPASVPRENDLNPSMLCDTLKMFLDHTHDGTQTDGHNNLISQLQSMQERIDSGTFVVSDVIEIFYTLGAKSSAPDSEGNTSLHYATQLLFYGVPEEKVTEVCSKLVENDARSVDAKNHKKETPLLFCLSSKDLMACSDTSNWSGRLKAVCSLLMEEGAELCDTTHKHETAFQLILKHCQYALLLQDQNRRGCIFQEMLKILELFPQNHESIVAVNSGDIHLNTPLHLWASMAMKSSSHYRAKVYDDVSFEDVLAKILQQLRDCGVKLNDENENDETPLQMCRTWTAVKLLLDAGAKPDVADSSGCTPLLAAAKRNTCIEKDSERFYPDVTQTPKEFWKEVLDMKLDPWTADKDGNSVLSILMQKQANYLAKALIEVACELQCVQSDAVGAPLLIAVCKDQSSENHWKFDLVKLLVDSRRSLVRSTVKDNNDTPLHFSCRNILELREPSVEDSVHWEIAQYLLLCGADVNAVGEAGESCLALSDDCPALKSLLSTPVDHSKLPVVLGNWEQSSQSHSKQLSLVARKVKYQQVGNLYLYQDHLEERNNSGSFVFAGIDQGGREVAVKRIGMSMMSDKERKKEESVLMTSQCDQVIQYLFCEQDEDFCYIAFELMEGDLEHYIDNATGADDANKLCKDLVEGLQFLQSQGIVHGNINPRTVFYHTKPNLCLKIGNCKTSSPRRGWVTAEVLKGGPPTNKSDVFSCGLVLHYLLSGNRRIHPFAPADYATKTPDDVRREIDTNIKNGNIVKMDDSLSPEATDLVPMMLDGQPNNRPSAADALKHPFFWAKKTKKEFLLTLANEPEFERVQLPLTKFEDELEGKFSRIVSRSSQWNDPSTYGQISATHNGIPKGKRNKYNFQSVADLLRFIRNMYGYINDHDAAIQDWWTKYFIFDDNYFPCLVMEVYNTVKAYNLHTSRPQIEVFLQEL